ncbi:MAG: Co2+/Mg2+ efflux protein ApaG [Pseudomonadota bacterium]|nr:Co2+/Mg2+ efflux protein ApaG [Pseudomonadota bacterium]
MKNNIKISVETIYLQQDSDPENNKYFFLYTISIRNSGSIGAKLLSRHWVIEDSNGKKQDVKGEGVVGEQPYLTPGEEFQYTSGAMIETSFGTMKGTYQMVDDNKDLFDAQIPEFILSIPRVIH